MHFYRNSKEIFNASIDSVLNCDSASLVLSCGYGTASSCITILCIIGIVHSLDAQQLTHGGTTAQQMSH